MADAKKTDQPQDGENTNQLPPADGLPNDGTAEHAAPRKRGRPSNASKVLAEANIPGAEGVKVEKPKPRPKKSEADAANLGKQLCGIHHMIALVTGMPEMAIAEQEGEMLAKGLLAISEEYGLALDGKTGASLQLFGAAAMVYAPRVFAISARIKQQKAQAAAAQGAQVEGMVQMPALVPQTENAEFAAKTQ